LGHSGSQAPQLMHSSVIFIAILYTLNHNLPQNTFKYKYPNTDPPVKVLP